MSLLMKCDDCQNLFSFYYDGEIASDQRTALESHLRSCSHCNREWQAFKATLSILHQMPTAKVPPGFLAGIHGKLESRSFSEKIKEWLAGATERKVAIPTAFAMLVIGFACASLLQIMPFSGQPGTTTPQPDASSRAEVSTPDSPPPSLLAKNMPEKTGHQDFYPGVPQLSEYEEDDATAFPQYAMVPRQTEKKAPTAVDFVSTGGHTHSYIDRPLLSLSRYHQKPAIQPDLLISIHASDPAEQLAVMRQIMQSPDWQADIYNQNTVLLSVPAGNFDQLRRICCQKTSSFTPAYARDSRYISPKRFLTVAVTLN
ncbi:MAG: hypothetical protein BM485_06300 [Desulfobulbaceae bacterium DB1]|nr:MAG: hypothetical protein BM485_06300 [Desulfobulbaceae bacterium DB1]